MDPGGLTSFEKFILVTIILITCGGLLVDTITSILNHESSNEDMPKQDRWEAIKEPTGWTVEHNGRLVDYDLVSLNDAKARVRRKGGTAALRALRVIDGSGRLLESDEEE